MRRVPFHPAKLQRIDRPPAPPTLLAEAIVAGRDVRVIRFAAVAVYLALQFAYSLKLKHVVILDIFVIAAGFVIRVVAGGLVIDVPISSWLLICTTLLALLLAMGKRRHELVLLEDKATNHRAILREYSAYLLDQMISVVTASTLIAYCLYTISAETVAKFGTEHLIWTAAFVLYGIFRYLYLIHQKGKGGSPEEMILQDRPLNRSAAVAQNRFRRPFEEAPFSSLWRARPVLDWCRHQPERPGSGACGGIGHQRYRYGDPQRLQNHR